MSSEVLRTDWFDPARLKTAAARRFVEFCQQKYPAPEDNPAEQALYKDAVQLVLERLEQGLPAGKSA